MVDDLCWMVIDGLVEVGLIYVGVVVFYIFCCFVLLIDGFLFESKVVCEECKGLVIIVFEKVIEGFLWFMGLIMD